MLMLVVLVDFVVLVPSPPLVPVTVDFESVAAEPREVPVCVGWLESVDAAVAVVALACDFAWDETPSDGTGQFVLLIDGSTSNSYCLLADHLASSQARRGMCGK